MKMQDEIQIKIEKILKPVFTLDGTLFLKVKGEEAHRLTQDIMNFMLSKGYVATLSTNALIKGDSND